MNNPTPASPLEALREGLRLISMDSGATPEERKAFCSRAGIKVADSSAIAKAALLLATKLTTAEPCS